MREYYESQLAKLNTEMIQMGARCEDAISGAIQALLENNRTLAEKVDDFELEIDQYERDIERLCMRLLLLQQPVATDLRMVSSALKMISDLERIGDQALDIAETAGFMGPLDEADAELFKRLAQTVVAMVTDSVDAFVRRDSAAARAVARRDDEADEVFKTIKSAMIERLSRRPGDGEYALDLLMIAKYLERIGDHATNIAEWVEFAATGCYKGREVL